MNSYNKVNREDAASSLKILKDGRTIPAECLYQDVTCMKQRLVRTYGVLASDRNLNVQEKGAGGADAELVAFVARDEGGEPVYPFGSLMGEPEQLSGLAGDLGAFAGIGYSD